MAQILSTLSGFQVVTMSSSASSQKSAVPGAQEVMLPSE